MLVRAAMDNGREGEDAFGWHRGSATTAVDPFRIRSFPAKTFPEGEGEQEQQIRGAEGAGWEAGPGTAGCSLLTLQTALEAWSVVVGEAVPGLWSVCQRQAGNRKGQGLRFVGFPFHHVNVPVGTKERANYYPHISSHAFHILRIPQRVSVVVATGK
jgi:hypothetical protein